MTRGAILTAVVLVHLAVFWVLMGSCRRGTERAGEPGVREEGAPADDSGEAGDSGGSEATGVGADPDRFGDHFFLRAVHDLPAPLAAAANGCGTGIVVDWTGRLILWEKEARRPVAIASLTKMMTAFLLMESVAADPAIDLSTEVQVTRTAAGIGGRQVWLDPRESFALDELLKAVMIRSANDCAYQIGEFLAGGDHARFVERMNTRCGAMGLTHFRFHNSHGLPTDAGEENMGCAEELAYLAGRLVAYEEVVRWSSTRLSYLREDGKPFQLVNTNRLIDTVPGVNGMKTGYTRESGYCLVATCERAGRTHIVVATGCASAAARNALVTELLEWSYRVP